MAKDARTQHLGLAGMLMHLAAYVFLWAVFSGGGPSSWVVGAPAVLLALWATYVLAPVQIPHFNPVYVLVFVPVFLRLSFHGGIDVARRAMGRRVRVAPALLDYALRLEPGTPRFFFMLCISLLPGTLSADLDGDRLTVHVLDGQMDNAAELAQLEGQVARLFGVALDNTAKEEA